MLKAIGNGLYKDVSCPAYGRQDIGITPGGAMDQFSYECGNILLGNPTGTPAWELLFAPEVCFEADCFFTLTGAVHKDAALQTASETLTIEHATVYFAPQGSILTLKNKIRGFRTYLCWKAADGRNPAGTRRPAFEQIARWTDRDGHIRVIEGPEYRYLNDPDQFLKNYWKITWDTSEMGMRITSDKADLSVSLENMISEAVADGTVQLTPKGPIILLRHRQTVGGYPRIFNVISADVDLLGQFQPDQLLHFKQISLKQARKINRIKIEDLMRFRKKHKYT